MTSCNMDVVSCVFQGELRKHFGHEERSAMYNPCLSSIDIAHHNTRMGSTLRPLSKGRGRTGSQHLPNILTQHLTNIKAIAWYSVFIRISI